VVPTLTLVAGPNGSGKSTLTAAISFDGTTTVIDPDVIYVALGDPKLHIEQVRLRVSRGGHDIPDTEIRRRYWRSMSHAPEAIRLAQETVLLDNSGLQPERVLALRNGRIIWQAAFPPNWAEDIASALQ